MYWKRDPMSLEVFWPISAGSPLECKFWRRHSKWMFLLFSQENKSHFKILLLTLQNINTNHRSSTSYVSENLKQLVCILGDHLSSHNEIWGRWDAMLPVQTLLHILLNYLLCFPEGWWHEWIVCLSPYIWLLPGFSYLLLFCQNWKATLPQR